MTPHPVYSKYVQGRDALRCLDETSGRISQLVRTWPRDRDAQSYAPGKWNARRILQHLAQIEMVFSVRLRFALSSDRYVVQPFEQDDWIAIEPEMPALTALDGYMGMRSMNLRVCQALTPEQRTRRFTHPEFGEIDVDWLMGWCAGHELHHLQQLETIAKG